MKTLCVVLASLACAAIIAAQSATDTYSRDINGRKVPGPGFVSDGKGGQAKLYQNLNGRQIPLQETTERVIEQKGNTKTTERIVRNFDRNGQLVSTDRILIQETRDAGGSANIRETQYRTEANGQTREVERRTIQTRVQGQTTTSDVVVDRPSLNGGFATAEKRNIVTTGPENRRQTVETVSIASPNGTFQPERRQETLVTKQGAQTITNTATYEPDPNQRLALSQQTVATSTQRPDGQTVTELNIYGTAMRGRVYSPGDPLQIVEQHIVTQTVAPDGTVTQTLNTRLPSLADPNRLGPPQFVAETTCVGKCLPAADAAQEASAATTPAQDAKGKQKGKAAPVEQAKAETPATAAAAPVEAKAQAKGATPPGATVSTAPAKPTPAKPAAPAKPAPAKQAPAEDNPPLPRPKAGDPPLR